MHRSRCGELRTSRDRKLLSAAAESFEVTVADPVALVERHLAQRSIDLAIGAIFDDTSTKEVEIVRLFTDRHVVMASKDSKWARRRKIDLAELANEAWILPL